MFPNPLTSTLIGAPPVLELIDKKSASASATVDIFWTAEYEAVIITADDINPATADTELWLRTTADGSTFDTGASDYDYQASIFGASFAADQSTGATFLQCLGETGAGTGIGEGGHLTAIIMRPYDSGKPTLIHGQGGLVQGGGSTLSTLFAGRRIASGIVNGVQFLASSGNLTTGNFTAHGILRIR